jgi:hypothetical protein
MTHCVGTSSIAGVGYSSTSAFLLQDVPTAKVVAIPPVENAHTMRTRGKTGLRILPSPRLNLQASTLSPLPKTYCSALVDPNWHDAMIEEFSALQANNAWMLVPHPPGVNIMTGKWFFRHKLHADGSLDRFKARWVLHGFTQQDGIDFGETFSLVVKPATIRTVLSLGMSRHWPIHQLDVKNAFLHVSLTEIVYAEHPSGFTDSAHPDHVCHLNKSLYGLKQAPHAWYSQFASHLLSLGFVGARSNTSMFIYQHGSDMAYLLLYVDDIVLTASSDQLLCWIISALTTEFCMKDMGPLHHFLGMSVTTHNDGLFLSQRQYMLEILERARMTDCKPCTTPVDTSAKVSSDGPPVSDVTHNRGLASTLQYLIFTRPDIAYAIQQVCLYMHDPCEPHLALIKRILRYL